jgi:hypothetical protein
LNDFQFYSLVEQNTQNSKDKTFKWRIISSV